jgi:hypothetical protein
MGDSEDSDDLVEDFEDDDSKVFDSEDFLEGSVRPSIVFTSGFAGFPWLVNSR